MTAQGFSLTAASAFLTMAANLLMRAGILRQGEFRLSTNTIPAQLFGLAKQPMFVAGFTFYGLAAVVWFRVLSVEDLSTSYPILVGMTFVLVTIGAVLFFHEQVSWIKLFGIATILAGILLVARA